MITLLFSVSLFIFFFLFFIFVVADIGTARHAVVFWGVHTVSFAFAFIAEVFATPLVPVICFVFGVKNVFVIGS